MDRQIKPTYSPYEVFTMTAEFVDDQKAVKIIYEVIKDEKNRYTNFEYIGMLHALSIATA